MEWVTKQFASIAGEDKEIDLEEFKAALKVKESFFAERFFALFDSDGSGTISLEELLKALNILIHGSETDKLSFLFQVYDVDGSGSIDPDELRTVLKSCLKESAISLPEEKLDDLTLALFESADKDSSGSITFEELKEELESFPDVMENLTISAANWLKPPTAQKKKRQAPRYLTPTYWHNNRSKLFFMCCYICVNILLFTFAALKHAALGRWILIAKGCGQCLNFNCTFVVVLMLRRCLTWLRATWIVRILPLDQHVLLHQLVGWAIFGFTLVHTGAHLLNFVSLTHSIEDYQLWEYLFTTRPGIGWTYGAASITGIILLLLIFLMIVCSSTFVRRSGHFEVFYWTHLFYIWVWALLVLHCPNFWKWFVVPGFIFLMEKIIGIAVSRIGGLYIVEVNLLPSKVTHLVIRRPQFFHYKPGDYVYLNIPAIAKYEWHPFTISSAPEQQESIWLHIRSLGQWTNRLYEYFRQTEPLEHEPKRLTKNGESTKKKETFFKIKQQKNKTKQNANSINKGGIYLLDRETFVSRLQHQHDPVNTFFHNQNFGLTSSPVVKHADDPNHMISLGKPKKIDAAVSVLYSAICYEKCSKMCPSKSYWNIKDASTLLRMHLNIYKTIKLYRTQLYRQKLSLPLPPKGNNTSHQYFPFINIYRSYLSMKFLNFKTHLECIYTFYSQNDLSSKLNENHRFCNIKVRHTVKHYKGQWRSEFIKTPIKNIQFIGIFSQDRRSNLFTLVKGKILDCYIDGPYGTPTRQIFASEHAVLIGAGIGITPFASILQSIMYRYRMRKQNCPSCYFSWCENLKDNEMKLRKVDFIWINRDQKSFEWFVSLLTKLEMDQADEEPEGRFLEMHMYMTSALSKNDMKAIGLQMALDLLAKKEKRDSITGLRTRTQPGRPDWSKVFQKLAEEKKGKVHVFFCGSPSLAKVIKAHCEQFNFKFYKENF
uniref:NADPH oxidase 5 n=1 Tax=Latimeria chalumnae TaxID=7897 RepID=H3B1H0_LATCH